MTLLLPWVKSLRARYLFVAVTSMCFVIVLVIMVSQYITDTNQALFDGIERRLPVSLIKENLSNNVKLASRDLELYLFEPAQIHQTHFDQHIEYALVNAEALSKHDWVKKNNLDSSIANIDQTLRALQQDATQLMLLRLDANRMYPVLQQANSPMLDANENITTSLTRAIAEQRIEVDSSQELMSLLVDARDNWRRVITTYRLYIVNRMGSLFVGALNAQVESINEIYQAMLEKLKKLEQIANQEDIGLETLESIESIQIQMPRWYSGFEQIVQIKTTNDWRSDVDVVINDVYPLLDEVYKQLNIIDKKLYQSSESDVKFQQQSKDNLSYALWILSAFIFLIIISIYIVLDRVLLKPIASISHFLRTNSESKLGKLLPSVKGTEIGEFVSAFDYMQKQVKLRQEELLYTATHDALTLLPNRSLLAERLDKLINEPDNLKNVFALLILDLDRFKEVNDTLGHMFGDRLLCHVADRLTELVRKSDFVARLGGDEFAIIINEVDANKVEHITKVICNGLEEVYTIDDHNLYLGVSVGIALYPQHGSSSVALMKHADIAMYNAKNSNINFDIYESQKSENNGHKLSLLSDLRIAIDKDELFIELQPIFSVTDNRILGFESLLRWNHPQLSIIYPDAFIQSAEQTGLIRHITHWVIEQALKACKSWQDCSTDLYIAVNVTAWDLHENIVDVIDRLLKKYELQPSNLVLELTERSVMTESTKVQHTLDKLSDMGVKFAMDDFGTGFSSMTYLQKLPIKLLKIDRSFVMYMSEQNSDASIVRSIIDLAHNLELSVIAEGVETQETLDKLVELNCDGLQGNFLSSPVNEEQAIRLIQSGISAQKDKLVLI